MPEYEVFKRGSGTGEIYLMHRAEITYVGNTLEKHLIQWIDQGYGGNVIESLDEDPPGFAVSDGGPHTDFDKEIYIVERYGSEEPTNMSVAYAVNQMKHVRDSIENNFTGASPIDVYSKVYCETPVLPPEELFQIVEDPADELEFEEV